MTFYGEDRFSKVDIAKLITYCRTHLEFTNLQLDQAYFYQSLPLCVIDAVYSIGVRYSATEATVGRFCEHFKLTLSRALYNLIWNYQRNVNA